MEPRRIHNQSRIIDLVHQRLILGFLNRVYEFSSFGGPGSIIHLHGTLPHFCDLCHTVALLTFTLNHGKSEY